MTNQKRRDILKGGMTAVEVVVSILLASMLMVAMLSVLQGLKAHEKALNTRLPRESWQQALDHVLQRDLANSRTYELAPHRLVLRGFAGRDEATRVNNWKPASIIYEIIQDDYRSWLTRREPAGNMDLQSGPRELVLVDVTSIRLGVAPLNRLLVAEPISAPVALANTVIEETPITNGLTLEFTGSNEPIYQYQFRKP